MATSFIGKTISLLSISDVRYKGILAGLDPANSTIQLQNVFSMGTENRRPPEEFIPPADQPYQYIIFRASEVKDIALDSGELPLRQRSVHDDPAVIGASGPPIHNGVYERYPGPGQQQYVPEAPQQQVPATLGSRPPPGDVTQAGASTVAPVVQRTPSTNVEQAPQPQATQASGRTSSSSRRGPSNSVSNAAASLEKVERALGDLRLSNAQVQAQQTPASSGSRSGRRGGRQHPEIRVPNVDFDFASSNARFDKQALSGGRKSAQSGQNDESDGERTNPSDDEGDAESKTSSKDKATKDTAYNPRKSFFDTLSSSAHAAPPQGERGRGGGRRGMARSRREEEREKNVATFGEPGGVGLMGPGAYVGGYGGYGSRRGGGRTGRRGGGRRNNVGVEQ